MNDQRAASFASVCQTYPNIFKESCKQRRLNALVTGHCEQLSGCDATICHQYFQNGVYPRLMRMPPPAQQHPQPPKRVYAFNAFPQLTEAAIQTTCTGWAPRH